MRLSIRLQHVLLIATMAVTLGHDAVSGQLAGRLARAFPASAVKPLEIRVVSGTIDIQGEDRPDVSLVIERPGGELPQESISETNERIAVDLTHIDAPGEAPVQVTVRAPRATPIPYVHVSDGGVLLARWRGTVQVKVERGSIVADDVAGIVRLETGSGDITVKRAALPRDGLLRCRTETGNVTVALEQAPTDARILLMTLTGAVTSDLPVADKEGFGGRLKEGRLGNGQPLLSLDAVRGNLTVTVGR